ncbi:MAG TPA: HAD family phosphatase [Polyangia bacterium]|nr:HAD family phosphatase [Polyangia bacterium]
MRRAPAVTTLFLDIGGVLLTDGWDRHARRRAAKTFKLDGAEMEERHHMTFETYEEGKLTLDDYLDLVVFCQKRDFTRSQFRRFMHSQSKPHPQMIALVARLKDRYGLKIVVVSNEARELNAYRIRRFKLTALVDAFISSCFVQIRKPDAEIFRLALDVAQAPAPKVVFIDNTPMFVEIAQGLGIRSIHHTDYSSTCAQLTALGLQSGDTVAA